MSENTERERLIDRRKMVELVLENPYKFDNATLSAQIIMALKEFDAEVAALSRPVPDDSAAIVERAFEQICREEPLSGIARSDIQKWVDLLGPLFAHGPVVPVTGGVDLEAIEARANKVTRGPWITHMMGNVFVGPGSPGALREIVHTSGDSINDLTADAASRAIAIAEFIAHARTDVPSLVAEVRALRSRLSPPTRETLAEALLAARLNWAGEDDDPGFLGFLADAVLALLSSPETEGESRGN